MATPHSFSERHGLNQAKPITIRYEAPEIVRTGVLSIAEKSGFTPNDLRSVICSVLDQLPDTGQNWGYSNVISECKQLVQNCEWFEVYDICETLIKESSNCEGNAELFETNLNNFFVKKGIGWKMENGLLSVRGEEDYEEVTSEATVLLEKSGRSTALDELKEAKKDISRGFPEFVRRYGEDVVSESIPLLYRHIKTYDLRYRDAHGNPKPVRFVTYIWKRIDGHIVDSLKNEKLGEDKFASAAEKAMDFI